MPARKRLTKPAVYSPASCPSRGFSLVQVQKVVATPDPERLVCLAARGDYMKSPPWTVDFDTVMKPIQGKTPEEKIERFLQQLILAGHWGPFEHPVITFGIEGMSRVTLAQLTRHRIASFDIQSGRYVSLKRLTPEDFIWPPSFSLEAVKSRERGAGEITLSPEERAEIVNRAFREVLSAYQALVQGGVPKEDARYLLPEATPVNGTMSINARSLMHVIALRSFGDAQWEIRDLVSQMLEIAHEWMPITFRIFEKKMKSRDILAP